jgi:outer membrane protein assembly factor BamD (BamD/ComL family)
MRKYKQAIEQLNAIRKYYPNGDKWHMSYVMLGMIHNQKGEKSRALFILNEALEKNPPQNIRKIIDLMLNKIQGEPLNVTS